MPVGVMRSSAMTMPMKPIARPRRRPVKISAAACGSTIFSTSCTRVPWNERHICRSDGGVLRMPL